MSPFKHSLFLLYLCTRLPDFVLNSLGGSQNPTSPAGTPQPTGTSLEPTPMRSGDVFTPQWSTSLLCVLLLTLFRPALLPSYSFRPIHMQMYTILHSFRFTFLSPNV